MVLVSGMFLSDQPQRIASHSDNRFRVKHQTNKLINRFVATGAVTGLVGMDNPRLTDFFPVEWAIDIKPKLRLCWRICQTLIHCGLSRRPLLPALRIAVRSCASVNAGVTPATTGLAVDQNPLKSCPLWLCLNPNLTDWLKYKWKQLKHSSLFPALMRAAFILLIPSGTTTLGGSFPHGYKTKPQDIKRQSE